jgi:hypothetical protein
MFIKKSSIPGGYANETEKSDDYKRLIGFFAYRIHSVLCFDA